MFEPFHFSDRELLLTVNDIDVAIKVRRKEEVCRVLTLEDGRELIDCGYKLPFDCRPWCNSHSFSFIDVTNLIVDDFHHSVSVSTQVESLLYVVIMELPTPVSVFVRQRNREVKVEQFHDSIVSVPVFCCEVINGL